MPCVPAVVIFLALTSLAPQASAGLARERYAVAERAVDGDTIKLRGGERVRYLGMDSPEKGEPFYDEAKKRNSELVRGKKIRLVVCSEEPRDKYGRTLAWVYAGGESVNAALLREGLGKSMIIPPCGLEKEKELRRIEKEAQEGHRGIWGLKGTKGRPEAGDEGKVVSAQDAFKHIGEAASVRGRVKDVHRGRNIIFINFGSRPQGFTAVIFKSSFNAFASAGLNPMSLRGKAVTVKGVVRKYGKRAEIIVKLPTQLDVD